MSIDQAARTDRRRRQVVAAIVLVCVVAAVVTFFAVPQSYTATATVRVVSSGATQDVTSVLTQAELIQQRPLAAVVVDRLHLPETPEELLGKLKVNVVGQTSVIEVGASDRNPQRSAQIANAVVAQYLQSTGEGAQQRYSSAQSKLSAQLAQSSATLASLTTTTPKASKTAKAVKVSKPATLSPEAQLKRAVADAQRQALIAQMAQLNAAQAAAGSDAVLVASAVAPASVSPWKTLAFRLLIGLLVGVMLGGLYWIWSGVSRQRA